MSAVHILHGSELMHKQRREVRIHGAMRMLLRPERRDGPGQSGLQSGTELEFVIMVIAVSCVKLLSAHNSTQHTSRKHKV
jgi:hypothetical protein